MSFDENLAQRVREVLAEECAAKERRMFGGAAFMAHGHMCCGVVGEDLVIRVGAEGHTEALSKPHARAMDFTGRPMKGFVYVSPAGYRTKAALKIWIQRGLQFIGSLPPR